MVLGSVRFTALRKKSVLHLILGVLHLILGGAAVHRCGMVHYFKSGFSR
jgi:hypothetical protein